MQARPVKVYVTDKERTYKLLTSYRDSLKNTGGFFRNTINGNYAVMRRSTSTLFHEYTHYITSNLTQKNLPIWYNEGLAEFLGEIEFRDDNIVYYGKIDQYHIARIANSKWMPIETLFRTRVFNRQKRERLGMSYAMSWLAVHYFRSDPARSAQLSHYLSLTQSGMDEADALRESMGLSFDELNRELRSYAQQRRYNYTKLVLSNPLTKTQLQVQQLNKADAAYHIGEYFLQAGYDSKRAERYFDEALRHNAEHVGALTGKANVALFRGAKDNFAEAKTLIDAAQQLQPEDGFAATISGHIHAALRRTATDQEQKNQLWNTAVRSYNRAIDSGQINLEAISSAANMYAQEDRWDKAYELYEIVYTLAPSNHQARLSMIQAHLSKQEIEAAAVIAERVTTNGHFSEAGLQRFQEWYDSVRAFHAKQQIDSPAAQ